MGRNSFSYKHAPTSATYWCLWQHVYSLDPGETIKFRAYVKKTVAMVTTPKIAIFRDFQDPLAYSGYSYLIEDSMTDSINTWETLDAQYTNPYAYQITVVCRTMAKNVSGYAYFCPEIIRLVEQWG
jgi:hypothetical protein